MIKKNPAASAQSAQAASSLQLLAALQRKQCNSAGSGGGIAIYAFYVRVRAVLKQKLYNIDITTQAVALCNGVLPPISVFKQKLYNIGVALRYRII